MKHKFNWSQLWSTNLKRENYKIEEEKSVLKPAAEVGRELWWSGSSWVEKIKFFYGALNYDATSGSMVPRLVPEISSLDAFCDGGAAAGGAAAGIGDSRSWMGLREILPRFWLRLISQYIPLLAMSVIICWYVMVWCSVCFVILCVGFNMWRPVNHVICVSFAVQGAPGWGGWSLLRCDGLKQCNASMKWTGRKCLLL